MHRWSELFIPTLREAPADAEVASHKLLVRSGYIRQLGAGIYSFLFLGNRTINKIMGIVREEMDKIGQEFYLPTLHPRDLWEESGRWSVMGDNMFRLKDRKGADLCLGMTHEEVMTDIARKELRSYKQLPQIWYQIQNKFRDEQRPKSGLLRTRQFTMKDSYSFDIDADALDEVASDRDSDQHTRNDPRHQRRAVPCDQPEPRVRDQRAHTLDRAHEREADPEFVLDEALISPEQRERRPGDRGHGIEEPQARAERLERERDELRAEASQLRARLGMRSRKCSNSN